MIFKIPEMIKAIVSVFILITIFLLVILNQFRDDFLNCTIDEVIRYFINMYIGVAIH